MSAPRPFRFGVLASAATAEEWTDLARRTEAQGYDLIALSDHLDLSGPHIARMSAIPALGAAAAATETIGIGTAMINQDFHLPAMLAREAATLDILSKGRFELGIGAGHTEYENEWAGVPFDEGRVRVRRVAEYAQAVRAVLETDGEASFAGEYVRITAMPGEPRPVQRPRPRIMLGGTRKGMLSVAAREADIVSINLYEPGVPKDPSRLDRTVGWIREAAGERFDQLELHLSMGIVLVADGDRLELVRGLRRELEAGGMGYLTEGMTDAEVLEAPIALIGDVDQIVADLESWRDRWGISYLHVLSPVADDFAPVVERLRGR